MRSTPHLHFRPSDRNTLPISPANCFAFSTLAFNISSRTDCRNSSFASSSASASNPPAAACFHPPPAPNRPSDSRNDSSSRAECSAMSACVPSAFASFHGIPQQLAQYARHCGVFLLCQRLNVLVFLIGQANRDTGQSFFVHRNEPPFVFFVSL